MSDRILVIGGKGTTGRRVARRLEATGAKVAIGTRRPMDARDRPFDWADPDSVAAFDGCSSAYVVAPTDRTDHLDVMRPLLETAMARGVRRFVLLSSSLLERGGPMMGEVHDWLSGTAPEWAVLRPSWFMQNFSEGPHARTIRDEDAIYSAAGRARVGFIDADDIAAAAVACLTSSEPLNDDRILTGPEALSYEDTAGILSEVTGRTIRHVALSTRELALRFEAQGLPPDYAALLADLDDMIHTGVEDRTTEGVARLTGQAPGSFRDFAKGNVGRWQA
ncbi:NAD(P)H-binding protein [uncultured Jannaschia sp.]|uniref:NAD(P)H-binding protein n=1 Tax=uncultured Jannaschia sp. TaxID=293347 RepID=UPI00260ACC79|nr:NAD(P)H-binding protein [uncultured Jannaschia sp.]